ncbi:hypothetical protein ES704_03006 [subsurface metagenome]|jgi:ABC-type sulfate transport system substrate-binding protein
MLVCYNTKCKSQSKNTCLNLNSKDCKDRVLRKNKIIFYVCEKCGNCSFDSLICWSCTNAHMPIKAKPTKKFLKELLKEIK